MELDECNSDQLSPSLGRTPIPEEELATEVSKTPADKPTARPDEAGFPFHRLDALRFEILAYRDLKQSGDDVEDTLVAVHYCVSTSMPTGRSSESPSRASSHRLSSPGVGRKSREG